MAATDAASEQDPGRPNIRRYLVVFVALLLLTAVNVVVSKFHLPRSEGVPAGLLICAIQAFLAGAVFMHLWGEHKLIHRLLYVTAGFCAILATINMFEGYRLRHKEVLRVSVANQLPGTQAPAQPSQQGTGGQGS